MSDRIESDGAMGKARALFARFADAPAGGGLLRDPVLLVLLAAAFVIRLYVALTTTHIWDEEREWIVVAHAISFNPDALHLPIRSFNHGALPAYLIKVGSFLFGEGVFGFRFTSVVAGTASIAFVALIAKTWAGRTAALWAAALLAFNEYHVTISIFAVQLVFAFSFGALAAYLFVRALKDDRPRWLLGAAAAAALSCLCYEIMYLLIPTFAVVVLFTQRRAWFASPYLYLAAALGAAMLAPDWLWNLNAQGATEMTYGHHLERFGGFGLNRHYLLFFCRDAALAIYTAMGRHLYDGFEEYGAMNVGLGVMLLGATLFWTWLYAAKRERRDDPVLAFLLAAFWLTFLVFSFILPGNSTRLDAQGWLWIQFVMVPAAVLAGALIVKLDGRWRLVVSALAALSIVYGASNIAVLRLGLPAYRIAMLPQTNINVQPITYRAAILACALCDQTPRVELVQIISEDPDFAHTPPLAPGDIAGAEIGADDREYTLRSPRHRYYKPEYRITERSGATHTIYGHIWAEALQHPPPYWCADCQPSDVGQGRDAGARARERH